MKSFIFSFIAMTCISFVSCNHNNTNTEIPVMDSVDTVVTDTLDSVDTITTATITEVC